MNIIIGKKRGTNTPIPYGTHSDAVQVQLTAGGPRATLTDVLKAINSFEYEFISSAESLPAAEAATMHVLYLAPTSTANVYVGYLTKKTGNAYSWIMLGRDTYTKSEVDAKIPLAVIYNSTAYDVVAEAYAAGRIVVCKERDGRVDVAHLVRTDEENSYFRFAKIEYLNVIIYTVSQSGWTKETRTCLQESDITTLRNTVTALNDLVNADTDGTINKFNEIVAFLASISDSKTLSGILQSISNNIANKTGWIDLSDDDRYQDNVTDVQVESNIFTYHGLPCLVYYRRGESEDKLYIAAFDSSNDVPSRVFYYVDGVYQSTKEWSNVDDFVKAALFHMTAAQWANMNSQYTLADSGTDGVTITKNGVAKHFKTDTEHVITDEFGTPLSAVLDHINEGKADVVDLHDHISSGDTFPVNYDVYLFNGKTTEGRFFNQAGAGQVALNTWAFRSADGYYVVYSDFGNDGSYAFDAVYDDSNVPAAIRDHFGAIQEIVTDITTVQY